MAGLSGAREVVISDYPAPEVLSNIRSNILMNIELRRLISSRASSIGEVNVEGHEWGILTDSFSFAEQRELRYVVSGGLSLDAMATWKFA